MKTFKKILCGMLAVMMLFSLSMTAFASTEDTQATNTISPVSSPRGSVPSFGDIKVGASSHTSGSFVLRSAKAVTINLNVVSRTSGASMSIALHNSNTGRVDNVIVTSSGNYTLQAPTGGTYFVTFIVRLGSNTNYFVINYNINF